MFVTVCCRLWGSGTIDVQTLPLHHAISGCQLLMLAFNTVSSSYLIYWDDLFDYANFCEFSMAELDVPAQVRTLDRRAYVCGTGGHLCVRQAGIVCETGRHTCVVPSSG